MIGQRICIVSGAEARPYPRRNIRWNMQYRMDLSWGTSKEGRNPPLSPLIVGMTLGIDDVVWRMGMGSLRLARYAEEILLK